jgi:bacillopeptidase F (M6 metalloprotease family)
LELTTSDAREWTPGEFDLSSYLGQTVTVFVGAMNDGDGDTASIYVDDVELEVCP